MTVDVSPLNDLALTLRLKDVDPATSALIPLTSGAVSAFFAIDSDPATTAFDAALTVSATHVGGGKWLVPFDAAAITIARYDSLFGHAAPVIVILLPSGFRVYISLNGVRSRPAQEA